MDAIGLLDSDICELPRNCEELSYRDCLFREINAYCESIDGLEETDYASMTIKRQVDIIRTLGQHLIGVIDKTLMGQPGEARDEMRLAMESVADQLEILKSDPQDQDEITRLFRARPSSISEGVDREGIFHIPFGKRYLVGSQRYSMPGVPMLYLGTSLYACWEELGRKDPNDFWVSSFRLAPDSEITLLNMGYRPASIAYLLTMHNQQNNPITDYVIANALLWPLFAACSYKRKHPEHPFVEEYIIPQNLTSYIVESPEYDGIRYFSNRVSSYGGEILSMNIVMPARPEESQEYCLRLREKLLFTDPLPYSMVRSLVPDIEGPIPNNRGGQGSIEPFSGHSVNYDQTEFAQVEMRLLTFAHRSL